MLWGIVVAVGYLLLQTEFPSTGLRLPKNKIGVALIRLFLFSFTPLIWAIGTVVAYQIHRSKQLAVWLVRIGIWVSVFFPIWASFLVYLFVGF